MDAIVRGMQKSHDEGSAARYGALPMRMGVAMVSPFNLYAERKRAAGRDSRTPRETATARVIAFYTPANYRKAQATPKSQPGRVIEFRLRAK